MAVKRNYRINLRNYGNSPAIMVSQYDENYDLVFEVYDGVVPATGLNAYTVKLVGRQPGNDPALKYEFTGTVSGIANNILSFTIDTTMTGRAGKGTAEIVVLDTTNDVKFASFNLPVYVEKAAVPDDAIDADVERAQEIADEVQDIVDTAAAEVKGEAEAWAVGERDGEPVPSTDPTYHNNAKYYSEVAQDIADSIGIDATLSISGKAADAKKTGDEISSLKEDLNEISEEQSSPASINVPVDESDVRNSFAGGDVGSSVAFTSSTKTKCIVRAFNAEAGTEYTITINNGQPTAGSGTGTRDLIVASDGIVRWKQAYSPTTGLVDTVTITPDASGRMLLNIDANYASVVVTKQGTVTTITAKDAVARAAVNELSATVDGIAGVLEELSSDIGDISNIETIVDGTTETNQTDTVKQSISLENLDVRQGYPSNEIGQTVVISSSSQTKTIYRPFNVEKGKTYEIYVTSSEGNAIGARTSVISYFANNKVFQQIRALIGSGASDSLRFTAEDDGYLYLSVHANYTSITAHEIVPTYEYSAIDRDCRKVVFGGEVATTIQFEQGAFDYTLADIVDANSYRSNVINNVSDCVICAKINAGYTYVFGNGEQALQTYHGANVIRPNSDKCRIYLSDSPSNSGFEIRVIRLRGHKLKYDVVLAASDSSAEDKAIADFVCDGVNDEVDLQFAVNWNFGVSRNCSVLLLPGTYNIDEFSTHEASDGTASIAQYAVAIGNKKLNGSTYKYNVTITGVNEFEHSLNNSSVKIYVTIAGITTLHQTKENIVIGVLRVGDTEPGSVGSNLFGLGIHNLCICTNGYNNRIIAIDALTAGVTTIENCDIWAKTSSGELSANTIANFPDGSIGIRAGRGSCLGVRQYIKGNRISSFHEGIAICGEHFIVQDNLEARCTYGFTLNLHPLSGALQHPNVFVGNSVEQCYRMGKLGEGGMKQTLIYIGGSVENKITNGNDTPVAMLPIEVASNTKNRGRIESDSLASPYNSSFFEAGYGSTFSQIVYPYDQA